jgi:YD repeat-containing protein
MHISHAPFWNRLVTLFAMLLAAGPALAGNVTYTYDDLNRLTGAVDGDGTVIEYRYDAAGNRTSHVVQAAANLTLTLAKTGTGSGTVGGGGTYGPGDSVTLTATADTGSTFAGWSPSPCAASFTMPATDLTCTATFTLRTYQVTALAGAGGSISPSSRTVAHGATTTFTVTPNTGYSASVTGCGGSLLGTTYTTGSITAACTVSASFTQSSYTVTATAGSGGTANCDPATVNHDGSSICTATPGTGYVFGSWSGDCAGQGAQCRLTGIQADQASTVSFIRFGDDLTLEDLEVADEQTYQAIGTITVRGNVVVRDGGRLILRAGRGIRFQPGFSVQPGGTLSARIVP